MNPRFQFSLRNALWATFWASVWGASFSILRRTGNDELYNALGWPVALYGALILMSCALFFISPFIAAFSLFGRAGTGVVAGVVFMLVVFLILHPMAPLLLVPRVQ